MWIAVVSNSMTAFSLFSFTYQLLLFVNRTKALRTNSSIAEKGHLIQLTVALALLFSSFFTFCGLMHALNVLQAFRPHLAVANIVRLVVLAGNGVLSLSAACICNKVLPAITNGVLSKLELTSDGNLEHAENYMLEILEMVKESIMVISSDAKVVRKNNASNELFGSSSLIGQSILEFIHPQDVQNFERTIQNAFASYSGASRTIEYRIKPAAHIRSTVSSTMKGPPSYGNKAKVHCEREPERVSWSGPIVERCTMASEPAPAPAPAAADYIWVESTILKHTYMNKDEVIRVTLEMVSRNIDERKKQLQSQLDTIVKETEEQGRINSAKLRYLSCIAHDLKTPLQSFCYTLDLLLQTSLIPDQRDLIKQSIVAVDLMKLTISQTMDISKALSGAKLLPRRTTVLLSSVLRRVEIIIAGFGKQVPVSFVKAPDITDEIITDEEWLWQMLLNLLTNACKYTDKGCITVSVSLVDHKPCLPAEKAHITLPNLYKIAVEHKATTEMLLFEVIDTGVGVSDANLPIMFDAFAQVQDGQVTGTGLGLYGVRMRAEGLQGSCGARHNTESSTGTGTVMWFTVPYLPDSLSLQFAEQTTELTVERSHFLASPRNFPHIDHDSSTVSNYAAASVEAPSPSDLHTRATEILKSRPVTAMVVEDTLAVRKLMERMLLQMGFATVAGYDNGSKGLDAMMATQVDIVFSDVQMPVMTGPEMVTRFRKFEAEALAADTRSKCQVVVAVTANGSELRENTNVGFDDVYAKPLGRNDIYKIINRHLH